MVVINFASSGLSVEKLAYAFFEVNDNYDPPLLDRIQQKSNNLTLFDYIKKLVTHGNIYICVIDENIAGVIGVYTNDLINSSAHIPILFVTDQFKGRGIASRLLVVACDHAIKQNMKTIQVNTWQKNNAARKLYGKFSFKTISSAGNNLTLIKQL